MANIAMVPERTTLINVDLQNCFVDGYPLSAPDGLALLDQINRLAAVCRAAGILVIHTGDVLRPNGSNMGTLGETAPRVKAGLRRVKQLLLGKAGGDIAQKHRSIRFLPMAPDICRRVGRVKWSPTSCPLPAR